MVLLFTPDPAQAHEPVLLYNDAKRTMIPSTQADIIRKFENDPLTRVTTRSITAPHLLENIVDIYQGDFLSPEDQEKFADKGIFGFSQASVELPSKIVLRQYLPWKGKYTKLYVAVAQTADGQICRREHFEGVGAEGK